MEHNIYKYIQTVSKSKYQLLPFRFKQIDDDCFCVVNDIGEFHFLSRQDLLFLVKKEIQPDEPLYKELRSKYFIVDDESQSLLNGYIIRYRTKKSFLEGFTKLHMIVPTLRCNHSCPYCQVSRVSMDKERFDMSLNTAKNIADLILIGPARRITVEFQGGEPTINFDVVKYIVEYLTAKKDRFKKEIDFVLCSNLSLIDDDMLDFCSEFHIDISTSLDGPAFIHNLNRPKEDHDSHEVFERNLERVRNKLGMQNIAALMTTTKLSLQYPKEIIDEYVRLKFKSIFLRPLNPYGFALKTARQIGYTIEEFIPFYKKAFEYILELNLNGLDFQESFAKMILKKIITPYPVGFVDNQSPSGAGLGAVLYNYDGNVYPADEARMLAEMGDKTFCMGNVNKDNFEDIFLGDVMQAISTVNCNEALSGCSDCAYQPYCGSDPIRNYSREGHIHGQRYSSERCKKHMEIITYLMRFLRQNDSRIMNIFYSWVSEGTVNHMKRAAECQSY